MSFFNKLGEKISETGNDLGKIVSDTTQRAKESSRAVSLKKQIREEESKINEMCLYIMRLYLRDAKEETFPYPDMLKLVLQSEQKTSDYYREIEILDMQRPVPEQREEPVICPSCGTESKDGGTFCAQCGNKIR